MKTKIEYSKKIVGHSSLKANKNADFDFALMVLGVKLIPTSDEKQYAKK